jgi:hypothetical protein
MTRKTQGVYLLVEEVLQTSSPPYSEDIIEDVCLAIEHNPVWYQRYQDLNTDLRQWVVNNWIGQYVKQITGMTTIREVSAKRSEIITSYTKLAH